VGIGREGLNEALELHNNVKWLATVFLVFTSSVSLAGESDQPPLFEETGILLGIGLAGDQRFYLAGEGVFFYGFETSIDLHSYPSSITLGVVGSFEFHSLGDNVLMIAEPGLRIGALVKTSDNMWLHPYGVAGFTIRSMVVENKCDWDGACYSTNQGLFVGAGAGARWVMSDVLGISADFVLSYSNEGSICAKFRVGVVFSL
jgi:hypothetical protein